MGTGTATMTLDHSAQTTALDLAVDPLPEDWHLCAFVDVELCVTEAAAELATLRELLSDQ